MAMQQVADSAVILSARRTPIGSFGGVFRDVSAVDLAATAIAAAISDAGVDPAALNDVIMGCVLQAGTGMNVARQAAIKAGVPNEVPAETVNRVCGSGLQAVVHAAEGIRAGTTQLAVTGGMESMSGAPYLVNGARWGLRMGTGQLVDTMIQDGLTCALADCHMGMTAEEVALRYEISRQEQDAFAAESQRRAEAAVAAGRFTPEIVPVSVPRRGAEQGLISDDEHPRPGTTSEKLAGLRTAFKEAGTVTAGNSSGINDGAAALVVASERYAERMGAAPIARVMSYATAGVDPIVMGLGPIPAIRRAVERAGLDVADVDLFELNEAFAAQSLAVIRELGLDTDRVNVNGGAIALGHPIGASGARILTTLIHALGQRGARRGVAALCIGGGQGIAMVVETITN
jgi:acetyl-CoA C-acetyltransferase